MLIVKGEARKPTLDQFKQLESGTVGYSRVQSGRAGKQSHLGVSGGVGVAIVQVRASTKAQCVFMSNVLTCSAKVHVQPPDLDSSRFMATAAEIMLCCPLKALKLCNYCQLLFICGDR